MGLFVCLCSLARTPVQLSVFLSVHLSACFSVFLFICLSVCLSVCFNVYLCLSVCLSVYLSVGLPCYSPLFLSLIDMPSSFGPDQYSVLTGSKDCSMKIWSLSNGKLSTYETFLTDSFRSLVHSSQSVLYSAETLGLISTSF